MNKNSKGLAHLFLLLVLALAVTGGIGYWAYKNELVRTAPSQKQSTSINKVIPLPNGDSPLETFQDVEFKSNVRLITPTGWKRSDCRRTVGFHPFIRSCADPLNFTFEVFEVTPNYYKSISQRKSKIWRKISGSI